MRTFTLFSLLTLLSIVFFPSAAKGQTYYPMLTDSAGSWNITTYISFNSSSSSYTDSLYYTTADTVLGGVTYRKFGQWTYLREDTATQQVYFWRLGTERLMYDFSLALGDTFTLWTGAEIVVTDSGTVSTLAGSRPYLKLSGNPGDWGSGGYTDEAVWIQGIGDTINSFNYPDLYPVFDSYLQIRCVHKEGTRVWGGLPCSVFMTSRDLIVDDGPFVVFPQPSTGELNLEFPKEVFGAVNVELMDLQGRVVWREEMLGSGYRLALDVGGAIAGEGVYVLRVVAGDEVFVRKVLLER